MQEGLDGVGVEPHLLKECERARFGRGVEFGAQNLLAQAELAESLRALAAAHIAAHHQPMRVFAARIVREQRQRVIQTRATIALLEVMIGEQRQQIQKPGAQPLALDDGVRVRARAQIAAIKRNGAVVQLDGRGAVASARLPVARATERMALYEAGLAESGLDLAAQRQLREQAALWRFVYVAESQAQAEDELAAALLDTRRHMVHARAEHNPPDFHVPSARVNPWNDPLVSHEDGARYSLQHSSIYGTAGRVTDQIAELRDAGIHHVLCQMSTGYLPHQRVMDSMRRFGAEVIPRCR